MLLAARYLLDSLGHACLQAGGIHRLTWVISWRIGDRGPLCGRVCHIRRDHGRRCVAVCVLLDRLAILFPLSCYRVNPQLGLSYSRRGGVLIVYKP